MGNGVRPKEERCCVTDTCVGHGGVMSVPRSVLWLSRPKNRPLLVCLVKNLLFVVAVGVPDISTDREESSIESVVRELCPTHWYYPAKRVDCKFDNRQVHVEVHVPGNLTMILPQFSAE
jgi:hypothetical protein